MGEKKKKKGEEKRGKSVPLFYAPLTVLKGNWKEKGKEPEGKKKKGLGKKWIRLVKYLFDVLPEEGKKGKKGKRRKGIKRGKRKKGGGGGKVAAGTSLLITSFRENGN